MTVNGGLTFRAEEVKAQETDKRADWQAQRRTIPAERGYSRKTSRRAGHRCCVRRKWKMDIEGEEQGHRGLKGSLEEVRISLDGD